MAEGALGGNADRFSNSSRGDPRARLSTLVREIGEAVGLTSSSTVHTHLQVLQREGYLQRDPTKPRAISVSFEPASGAAMSARPWSTFRSSATSQQESVCSPRRTSTRSYRCQRTSRAGQLFMLRVRGESMIGAGIFDGDFVVVRKALTSMRATSVVAGIGDDEATVKTYRRRRNKVVLVRRIPPTTRSSSTPAPS